MTDTVKKVDKKAANKKKVYMTDLTLDAISNRSLSVFVNQSAQRLLSAGLDMKISKADIDFYKRHFKKFKTPRYEDQGALIQSFAELTGRTLCEAVIVLDRVERENYME